MAILSAILSIAASLGISAATLGISKKMYDDDAAKAAGKGTSTHEVTKAVQRLLAEAGKKGDAALRKAASELQEIQGLSTVMGSAAYNKVVRNITRRAQEKYNNAADRLNEFNQDKSQLDQKVASYSAYSDSYKNRKAGIAEAEALKQEAMDIANKYEMRLTE